MDPVNFEGSNLVLKGGPNEREKIGPNAQEVCDLHVLSGVFPNGVPAVISCWELSDLDLQRIVRERKVWVTIMAPANMCPPIGLQTNRPF